MKEMEIMVNPYQPFVDDIFSASNIRLCEKHVLSLQMKLDEAVANNDIPSIRQTFNLLAKNSKAVKVLAVHRITQRNLGKYTAGIDGVCIPKDDRELQYKKRLVLLNEIDIDRKPDIIKRVFIPKPNGKKRPLGIPTLRDRINQEILRTALEPIAEFHFSNNSWDFRPKRSCQDAIGHLFRKLCQVKSPKFVIEGDIKGCFDNIDHNHIIKTLSDWRVPKWATEIITKILKTEIFHNGEIFDSDTGTPQGGVISPLLANVSLTSFDNFCFEKYGKAVTKNGYRQKVNPLVRYADDFVITCKSEQIAKQIKHEITEYLSEEIGLTLSSEKTSITHITKGFNFLGFNIRKYPKEHAKKKPKSERIWDEYTLLIKPQKEKVTDFLRGCKVVIDNNKTTTQDVIIGILNPKLRGWAMYYRHVVSKRVFQKIDYEIWNKLYFWSKRRHPDKATGWIYNKYFPKLGKRKSVFLSKTSGKYIEILSRIPIRRFTMVNGKYRVYDKTPETLEYWKKREFTNAIKQIYSVRLMNLFKKQHGKCSFCKGLLTENHVNEKELHVHHMLPRSLGGTESYSNLRLLHDECHRELHAKLTRIEMRELWKHENYLSQSEK